MVIPAAVIIGREITVSALREWMAELGARSKVAVSIYGKIKTITQMVALILLIYRQDLFGIPIYNIGIVCLYIATTLTLWSMLQYITSAWSKIRESNTKQ
jgi:CDP-diacylglycerol--glycerol-3-phosphate 3-phosphatidyltransferase